MGEAQVVQLLTSSYHEQRRAPGVGELPLITVRGGERAHVAAMTPFILDDLAGGEEQDATSMRVLFDDVVQQSVGLCRLSDPDAGVVSPDVGVSKPLEPAIPLGTDELLKRGAIESRGADVPPEPHVGEGRRLEPSRLFQGGCRFQRSLDGVTTSPVTPGKGRQLGFRPLWRLRPIFNLRGRALRETHRGAEAIATGQDLNPFSPSPFQLEIGGEIANLALDRERLSDILRRPLRVPEVRAECSMEPRASLGQKRQDEAGRILAPPPLKMIMTCSIRSVLKLDRHHAPPEMGGRL